jgi:non-specific protein-tyrosine kinase
LVRDANADLAVATADIVAREFIDYAIELRLAELARIQAAAAAQGLGNVQSLVAAQFQTIDTLILLEPVSSVSAIAINLRQKVLLGVVLGAMLATGGALVLGSLRDTVRSLDEIPGRFGVVVLGSVSKWSSQNVAPADLVMLTLPSSGFSESFRHIRANFQFATVDQPGSIYMVTSPGPGEGKSTLIANLGIAFANGGKKVMIVDADLRRPEMQRLFPDVDKDRGLTTFLGEPATDINDLVQPAQIAGLSVIPSGPKPPNPSELLGSPRMSVFLERVKEMADIVLVDSPPTLVVADSPILAAQLDGVILVVDAFGTRSSSLRAALNSLRATQVNIVGVVSNKVKRSRLAFGYPNYYYDTYYYKYEESERASVNGAGLVFKRPVRWARDVFKKVRSPGNRR